jgi:hypothetical protein
MERKAAKPVQLAASQTIAKTFGITGET